MGLRELLAQTQKTNSQTEVIKNVLDTNNQADQQTYRENQRLLLESGDIQSQQQELDYQANLKTNQAKIAATQKFGADIRQENSILSDLANSATKVQENLFADQQRLAQLSSVSVLDNPLTWFFNQFKIDPLAAKVDAQSNALNTLRSEISARQIGASNQSKLQADLEMAQTKNALELSQRKTLISAQVAANESKIAASAGNSKTVLEVLNLTQDQLRNLYSVNAAANQEENQQMERARFALAKQEASRRLAKDLADDKDKAVFESDIAASIQTGRQIRGLTPLSTSDLTLSVKNLLTLRDKSINFADFELGQGARSTGRFTYGDKPSDYLRLSAAPGGVKLPAEKAPVHDLIVNQARAALAEAMKDPKSPYAGADFKKEPERFEAAINEFSQKLLLAQAKNIKPKTGNIFDIGDLGQWIKQSAPMANTALVQKVLKTRIDAGETFEDPNKVFTATAEAVRKNEITMQEALELATLYKRASIANIELKDFQSFGLQVPSLKTGYPTKVTLMTGNLWDSNDTVDLANPVSLKNAILSYNFRNNVKGAVNFLNFPRDINAIMEVQKQQSAKKETK